MGFKTDLLLAEIVWQVGNHDLVLGWNTIGWWTTLATLTWSTSWLLLILLLLVGGLVGNILEWEDLTILQVTLLLFTVRICAVQMAEIGEES